MSFTDNILNPINKLTIKKCIYLVNIWWFVSITRNHRKTNSKTGLMDQSIAFDLQSECQRLLNRWVETKAPPSQWYCDRHAMTTTHIGGYESLNLPVSRQRLEDLCGNIYSQWLTVCVEMPRALAMVTPSKAVSQRDIREVSLLSLSQKQPLNPTANAKTSHNPPNGRWLIKS